jgi:hypothetical protein
LYDGDDDNGGYEYWLPVSCIGAEEPVAASGSLVITLEVDSSATAHPTMGSVVIKMQATASASAYVDGMGTASGTATIDSTTKPATQTGAGRTGLLTTGPQTETYTVNPADITWSGSSGDWIGLASVTMSSFSASGHGTSESSSGAMATALDDEAPVTPGLNPGIYSNSLS